MKTLTKGQIREFIENYKTRRKKLENDKRKNLGQAPQKGYLYNQ